MYCSRIQPLTMLGKGGYLYPHLNYILPGMPLRDSRRSRDNGQGTAVILHSRRVRLVFVLQCHVCHASFASTFGSDLRGPHTAQPSQCWIRDDLPILSDCPRTELPEGPLRAVSPSPLAFFLDLRNSQPGRHTPKVSLFTSLRKTRRAMLLPGACHLVSKSFCMKSVGDQPSEGRPIPNSSPSRARYSSNEPNPRKRRIDLSPCVSVSPDCRRLLRAEGWVRTRVALLFDVVSTSPRFYR